MIFFDQRWLVRAVWMCIAAMFTQPVLGQDVSAQPPSVPASEHSTEGGAATTPAAAPTSAMLSQPHLPTSEIADVFRDQRRTPPGDRSSDGVGNAAESSEASEFSDEQIAQWIDQLGWAEFASRERATAKLRGLGKQALPALRHAAQEHADPEVRIRANDVVSGIAGNETAGRIDTFLAGKDVAIEGWDVARKILGDGVRVRELFVEIFLRHEAAATALEGTTEQRSEAFRATILDVQRGMYVELRLPSEADLIALLLLVNDREMPVSRVEEDALLNMMRRDATARLLGDAQLSGLFRALLSGWVSRPGIRNHQDMLWFAMNCDLEASLPLALETLQKSTDAPTLAMAMQAISRFGDKSNRKDVAKYLDDERAASEVQYFAGNVIEPQVRDAAMATIVLLSEKSLADFNMDENAVHPRVGFVIQAIGFPAENNELRLQAIEKVKRELVPAE